LESIYFLFDSCDSIEFQPIIKDGEKNPQQIVKVSYFRQKNFGQPIIKDEKLNKKMV